MLIDPKIFFYFSMYWEIFYSGCSQSSVSTPPVDFGCKKAIFNPSAPGLGCLSIKRMPFASIFLLVSEEPNEVLPTIQSRCQPLHIRAIEENEMVDIIESKYRFSKKDASAVAHVANGSFTKAISIIESTDENRFFFGLFKKMMRASASRKIKNIKAIANEIAGIGREMQKSYLLYCLRMFREYFINNLNEPKIVYLNSEEADFGIRFSSFINERNVEKLSDEFSIAYRQIEQNGNAKIIFFDLCLKVTVLLLK
jgi:DNA polymerase-3 subunit delta'